MKSRQRLLVALAITAISPCLMAASDPEQKGTILSISATGTARQDTRIITMETGVVTFSTKPARAWQDNADAMSKLKSELGRYGVANEDVRTTSLDLVPTEKHVDDERIKGFEVRHSLTVAFRDIKNAGPILDALVNAGANQVRGPRFSWQATEQASSVARAAAIREASQRAEFYARALGLKIKRIVSIRDGSGYA